MTHDFYRAISRRAARKIGAEMDRLGDAVGRLVPGSATPRTALLVVLVLVLAVAELLAAAAEEQFATVDRSMDTKDSKHAAAELRQAIEEAAEHHPELEELARPVMDLLHRVTAEAVPLASAVVDALVSEIDVPPAARRRLAGHVALLTAYSLLAAFWEIFADSERMFAAVDQMVADGESDPDSS